MLPKNFMRQIHHPLLMALWLSIATASLPAFAQQRAEAPPPPRLEKLEEGEAPAVTIKAPSEKNTITEQRAVGGKRTEVKVKTGKSTYRVQPAESAGNVQPGDAQNITAKPALFEVLRFDTDSAKKTPKEAVEPPPTLQPAPRKTPNPAK